MEPYITFKDTDKEGVLQYYVLQRRYPHYMAVILPKPRAGAITMSPLSGYHLYFTYAGTLAGNYLPAKVNIEQEIQVVFDEMAAWFYTHRILANPNRYKKFKI